MSPTSPPYPFPPIDRELVLARLRLTPGQRIQAMLDARELLVGFKRGRLRRRYPDLPLRELNLKLLEELDRAQNIPVQPR
jgi:hypothetical protein